MKRNNTYMIALIAAVLLVLTGCSGQKAMPAAAVEDEKAIAVNAVKAAKDTVEAYVTLNGKVMPIREAAIVPKASGRVTGIRFEVGQTVKAGDVLFTIDAESASMQLQQSEASLLAARTNLNNLREGTSEQQMAQLRSALVSAEVNYNSAKNSYDRTKGLYAAGAVTKESLEKAENQLKTSEEQYKLAKTNLNLTETKILPGNIAAAEAQVKQAEAAYEIARIQLDNTVVTSPIDGIVAARSIDFGAMAAAGAAAMTVVDISSLTVNVNVTEDIVNSLSTGDKVDIAITAGSAAPVTGEIISIAPSVNSQSKGYPVKIKIDNGDGSIKGGMFAEIRMMVDRKTDALTVPVDALVDYAGEKAVFVVEGDRVKRKKVTVGLANDKLAQVLSGLAENEAVVVKGQNLLDDGTKVVVTDL